MTATSLLRVSVLLLLACALTAQEVSPSTPVTAHTVVVLPFDNQSRAPGLEWIEEAFPEVLNERLQSSPAVFVVGRDERAYAFERLGIPAGTQLSRATLYRVAEAMDADFVVFGSFTFDGQVFTASAQVMDMKRLALRPEVKDSGALPNLIEIQSAIAWELLRVLDPSFTTPKQDYLQSGRRIRLDAFENYIRGVNATRTSEKVRYLREAVRHSPDYPEAMLRLGRAFLAAKDPESAIEWLALVPAPGALWREAQFYLGLAAFSKGDLERAQGAWEALAERMPLAEVQNNLGIALARRGRREAVQYVQKAVEIDGSDPDFRFNLALCLLRSGDQVGAARELKEAVSRNPNDTSARDLLDAIVKGTKPPKLPPERLKLNYDETSFRQLALEVQNAAELRFAKSDPATHARFHIERGREMLAAGFTTEAENNFREAVLLLPTLAEAHLGLAQARESANDLTEARAEARTALELQPSAEGYLYLARLDLRENKLEDASRNVDEALALAPANADAQALRRTIAAKVAEKRR